MERRNFLKRFMLGTALISVPVAIVSAAKDISKEKQDVLDKLSVDEKGQLVVKGGIITDGDVIIGSIPDKRVHITAPKGPSGQWANITYGK